MECSYTIIELDTIDSTNEEAKRKLSDIGHFTVISAKNQTSGRGQRGNTWKSNNGENLLISIVLKYKESTLQIPASSQMVLSCITALSVVKTLESLNIEAKIKWPNDIYIGDKKLCGILIENLISGMYLSSSIVGIGVNVNQRYFEEDIPNPISIAQCIGIDMSVETVLSTLLNVFESYFVRFATGEINYAELRELYVGYLWHLNLTTEFIDKRFSHEETFSGEICGILPSGKLMIETKGEIREFSFNEVSYLIPLYKKR